MTQKETKITTSADARREIVRVLGLDLVGPSNASAEYNKEILPQSPSKWYLTGFLVPLEARQESTKTNEDEEEPNQIDLELGTDDANTPESTSAKRAFFPSSIGLSFFVSKDTNNIDITAEWGDYSPYKLADLGADLINEAEGLRADSQVWKRSPKTSSVVVDVSKVLSQPKEYSLPDSFGLKIAISVKNVPALIVERGSLPAGAKSVSIFLVNARQPHPDDTKDVGFIFQAELKAKSASGFVPRPNMSTLDSDEWDLRVADLQYRNISEFAVGHGVSAHWEADNAGIAKEIATCWIPSAEVERVAPAEMGFVELGMDELAGLDSASKFHSALDRFVVEYGKWIETQAKVVPSLLPQRQATAHTLLHNAKRALARIQEGINLLGDSQTMEAFRLMNRVMAAAYRQRQGPMQGKKIEEVDAPRWRPFQLAFILMNLKSICDPKSDDRATVDLLFFPTGGGKTEAYLGLAAITLILRRYKNPEILSAGVSVLMRYTLRLLTLDQLSRAATLICALEIERVQNPEKLGKWPFEIGLWVGQGATPNRIGRKGDSDQYSARSRTIAFKNNTSKPAPIPLEECPWCGTKFKAASFNLFPDPDEPRDLLLSCANRDCEFTRDRFLPIVAVDDPIYRRLPCFVIATVDKFAALPWEGRTGALFGRVDRYDRDGFYGAMDPGYGQKLASPLRPPDLIIQDELHLISGPLGTMTGLYECALDELSQCSVEGKLIKPKIVASTATVRSASNQIRGVFNRANVDVFPPPGPDLRDSFFARTHSRNESQPRLYLGISAQARSPKRVLLRTYLALMSAAQKLYADCGGKRNKSNPVDPFMTLLGYFNSLRELGGSRRIVEDEVKTGLSSYGRRKRVGEVEGPFANRSIKHVPVELTSRVSTNDVADAKRKLGKVFNDDEAVDAALATNMISVGLDITRLGLMVVLGQPKTSAEYIQATSRVGREVSRPGLVVALLNIHRPRDRSHYERFMYYHESFYRSVEATSVTPFSPRALDRGLAGTLLGIARHQDPAFTPAKGAGQILAGRTELDKLAFKLGERAASSRLMDPQDAEALRVQVRTRTIDLLDSWYGIADERLKVGTQLQYQKEEGAAARLLYEFRSSETKNLTSRERKFRANRSLREVESSVNLWVIRPDGSEEDTE